MRVLVLDSNARDFPASLLVEQGLHEALAAEPNLALQLSFEYLSLTRFRGKAQRDADEIYTRFQRLAWKSSRLRLICWM